jgi:hypothetical protein
MIARAGVKAPEGDALAIRAERQLRKNTLGVALHITALAAALTAHTLARRADGVRRTSRVT